MTSTITGQKDDDLKQIFEKKKGDSRCTIIDTKQGLTKRKSTEPRRHWIELAHEHWIISLLLLNSLFLNANFKKIQCYSFHFEFFDDQKWKRFLMLKIIKILRTGEKKEAGEGGDQKLVQHIEMILVDSLFFNCKLRLGDRKQLK